MIQLHLLAMRVELLGQAGDAGASELVRIGEWKLSENVRMIIRCIITDAKPSPHPFSPATMVPT